MRVVRMTFWRTLGMARNYYATALSIGAFLAGAAMLFCFNVESAEGGILSIGQIWAVSLAPLLPILSAALAMDVWSDERLSGRIDMLLSAPVDEVDLVLGKFLGVFAIVVFAIAVSFASVFAAGCWYSLEIGFPVLAIFALLLQSALWCAVGVMASARFRHAAAAALAAVSVTSIVPRVLWLAAEKYFPDERMAHALMPFDAHVFDIASGDIPVFTVLGYATLSWAAIFVACKTVEMLRYSGYSARFLRRALRFSSFLALCAGMLAVALAVRLDARLVLPVASGRAFSDRTKSIVSASGGEIEACLFMSRRDRRFVPTQQLLRNLKREAEDLGGARISLRFVDPRWDIGAAERLVRLGGAEDSVVLRSGRRVVSVPVAGAITEREIASAMLRLSSNIRSRTVYWTVGHGEASFADYTAWGMSDIARELQRDGYRNEELLLESGDDPIPADCALILVAGAKTEFSRQELSAIDRYLNGGGRLLALIESDGPAGVGAILPRWGLKPAAVAGRGVGATGPSLPAGARTLSGSDVLISEFGDHEISAPLRGTQILLDSPVAIVPSAAAESGAGADKTVYSALASAAGMAFAAIGERGAGAGSDLMLRPTRVVAIGDLLFVMNGQLSARQNANRDFFLNAVSYLAGADAAVQSGADDGVLQIPLDRSERIEAMAFLAGIAPFAVFLAMILNAVRRRHRR